jgi:hypothetical protein
MLFPWLAEVRQSLAIEANSVAVEKTLLALEELIGHFLAAF